MSHIHENDKVCDSGLFNNPDLPHWGLPQMDWGAVIDVERVA